jgi:hypothetical protein
MQAKQEAILLRQKTAAEKAVMLAQTQRARQLAQVAAQHQRAATQAIREAKAQLPLASVEKFFRSGQINAGELQQIMGEQGYTEEYIRWTIQRLEAVPLTKTEEGTRASLESQKPNLPPPIQTSAGNGKKP